MSLYDEMKKNNGQQSYNIALNLLTRKKRSLFSALLELSPICNFSCPFCYARKTPEEMKKDGEEILPLNYWKGILDQFSEMGVLHIGFTGGECMLYPEFSDLYLYAIKKGFFVSMISNLSCMTDEIFQMFKRYPPKNISVTVYGASEDTYSRVCGNGSSYNKVMRNLKLLKEAGIRYQIQMTLCNLNQNDLQAVSQISKNLDVPFYFNESLISFQRCTEDIKKINSVDNEKFLSQMTQMKKESGKTNNKETQPPDTSNIPKGTSCSAGRNACFINHNGYMQPCVSFSETKISTFNHPISECWKSMIDFCDSIPQITECINCIHWNRCRHCFAMHYYDTYDFTKPSPRLCFKQLYPEKAAAIEAYYKEHGALPPIDD